MTLRETLIGEHEKFNSYFWIAVVLLVCGGAGLGYLIFNWYESMAEQGFARARQTQTLEAALHYKNFTCTSGAFSRDQLLRKISNDFEPVSSDFVPDDLVVLASGYSHPRVGDVYVRTLMREPIMAMIDDARKQGIDLRVNSAYRSHNRQKELYEFATDDMLVTMPEKAARPGYSEHQLGSAIDISQYPNNGQVGYSWLADNAYRYGFILSYPEGSEEVTGYQHEPWHWRYVGTTLSNYIYNKGVLFNMQSAVTLPAPSASSTAVRVELPYEYLGRDLWVWKSLEGGGQFTPIISGHRDTGFTDDIQILINNFSYGQVDPDARNVRLVDRDWIRERDTQPFIDTYGITWLHTSYASAQSGLPVERVEILYRDDIGYLIINHQEQPLAKRIVREIVGMCGFGR